MHQKAKFPLTYIPDVSCRVLEMPYIGKELSMIIMLPTEIADTTTGLEKVHLLVMCQPYKQNYHMYLLLLINKCVYSFSSRKASHPRRSWNGHDPI